MTWAVFAYHVSLICLYVVVVPSIVGVMMVSLLRMSLGDLSEEELPALFFVMMFCLAITVSVMITKHAYKREKARTKLDVIEAQTEPNGEDTSDEEGPLIQ